MISDQTKQLLKIKSNILSNLFSEKYGLKLGEFSNTTGTERVNTPLASYDKLAKTTND